MEIGQLEAFHEAVQRGSISRAADALALSQPALTARLRTLEQELGEPLLVRHVTGVTLTEAGRRFLPKVRQALTLLQQGVDDVRQIREATGGILRVGMSRELAPTIMPPALSRFATKHPNVEVQVRTAMSAPLAALLTGGEVEFAVVVRPLRIAGVRTQRLHDDRIHFVAAPAHPLAGRRSVSPADLGKAGLVVRESATFIHSLTMEFFHRHEVVPRIIAQADDTETVRRIVAAGQGVTFLPETSIRRELESGRLVSLTLPGITLPIWWIWVISLRGSRLSGTARAFLRFLTAELARTTPTLDISAGGRNPAPRDTPRRGRRPARDRAAGTNESPLPPSRR